MAQFLHDLDSDIPWEQQDQQSRDEALRHARDVLDVADAAAREQPTRRQRFSAYLDRRARQWREKKERELDEQHERLFGDGS